MSKTIPCRFEFKQEKENNWQVRVFADNADQLWGHRCLPQNQGKVGNEARELDRRGTNAAKRNLAAAISPRYFKSGSRWQDVPKTFEEFKQQAIERFQMIALDAAGVGLVYAPSNCVSEFWTAQHVKLLARALGRPRLRMGELELKQWLVFNWEEKTLFCLTRTQLAEKANATLGTSFKAEKVWQTAYRVGLFSDRKPGPRDRS